jgi:hypothetical protein
MKTRSLVWLAGAAALWLSGCGPDKGAAVKKDPPKPPQAVGGQMAAFRMYGMARQWALDAMLLRMENAEIAEIKGGEGKSGAWRAIFVSHQLGQQREYSYAVVESKSNNLKEGVFAQQPSAYQSNPQARPFLMAALKIESTAAYETAVKESADYIQKHPDTPVQFELSWTGQTPNVAWRVVWGPSVSRSDYSIFVDASLGYFARRSR